MDKIAVVILNWNGCDMLRSFLPSVVRFSEADGAVVYVADNGSTDASVAMLRREFPSVHLILLEENHGFADGYNLALKQVEAEYVVLLNSDVEVTEHWLVPLAEYMDAYPETAACQPKYKRKKNMQLMVTRYNLEQSEHELAELKVRQQELELKSVQSALYNSRQEATSFAVFLHSRNEMLEKIREMIKQGYKMDQQALIPHLKKVNAFISQYQNGDKTNSTLLMNVEEKNQEFLQRLSERHPNLTQGERYLATLLRVNLSTKEISMLTGNVPKTINMNRYRLRKSLNLSSEDDLTDYLQNI